MDSILQWNFVHKDGWTFRREARTNRYLGYELTSLPDFTNQRFAYLCKEADGRQAEVAKKQMIMLRQFHGLGEECGIGLRLLKEEKKIRLFLVFCIPLEYPSTAMMKSTADVSGFRQRINNSLMKNEYSFHGMSDDELSKVMELNWAKEAAEIIKEEKEYKGDIWPNGYFDTFYVPYMWTAAENNMERICSALMQYSGKAVVDITLTPSQYLEEEQDWLNSNLRSLKECMNGQTLRSNDGRKILWQGQKLPVLKTPLDNFEKLNKQYEDSRLFLSSCRIFAEYGAKELAGALMVNSVKNEGSIYIFQKGNKIYDYLVSCYNSVSVSPVSSSFWTSKGEDAPYRAQRLAHLVSIEEASNFFRIPIPVRPGFPGFDFDTGLESFHGKKKERSTIRLGGYLDEPGSEGKPAVFDSQQFAKHGLIVGVPGSGKTTAMFNILYQLWAVPDEQKIPFIILEPAKTEYRALKLLDEFREDMLVFTLGDEGVSPFRFNPMEILPGIKLETHMSKLQACFVGAFDLFDPLPLFLEQAIRRSYQEKGWYDDSRGGDLGLETPTISDLCRNAEYIVAHSGFDKKIRSDLQASLLERLNSLRRGSKGRMLDTKHSIAPEELMQRPVVLELDSLNGDEKSLIMMFLLSYVYEYCKVFRKSGSPLKHMLVVEEAHNLIASQGGGSSRHADPKAQTIELFVNMLAEMRALGQGILIADQLPTAIAPQAVKQTNVKILMRVTAKDDREEIGNTMDLTDEQMHQVVNFKTGHAYLYHEGEDRVRAIRMVNFKGEHHVEEPPSDDELESLMSAYEEEHRDLYLPYPECVAICVHCNRRVRNQAENLVDSIMPAHVDVFDVAYKGEDEKMKQAFRNQTGVCTALQRMTIAEKRRITNRYGEIGEAFGACVYIHLLNKASGKMDNCPIHRKCGCGKDKKEGYFQRFLHVTAEGKER